jgi:hypothetical protein
MNKASTSLSTPCLLAMDTRSDCMGSKIVTNALITTSWWKEDGFLTLCRLFFARPGEKEPTK